MMYEVLTESNFPFIVRKVPLFRTIFRNGYRLTMDIMIYLFEGLKHIKDKRKYKANTTKNPKYVPQAQKSKPSLGSNWDRYETQDSEEHQLSSSTDFAVLSSLPASVGSHFQFKNEQIRDTVESNESMFCLNLDLLDKSVLRVPFYDRVGMEKEWFEELEILGMNQNAIENLKVFDELFRKSEQVEIEESSSEVDCSSPSVETSDNRNNHNEKGNDEDDNDIAELIDGCSLEETNQKEDQVSVNKSENNDLEQWLDDILED